MYFPTTQWSLLARASLNGETTARQALEDLCHRYWLPLHKYIRSRGYTEVEAQDLTQEFFLHLMEHATLKRADPLRGRFRSFLLGALIRFLRDQRERRQAKKRGGGALHLNLDEEALPALAANTEPAVVLFDREWALVILEEALRRLHGECQPDLEARFAVLRGFLPGSLQVPNYESAA